MGELEKAVAALEQPPERSYLDDWHDESLRRTHEFINLMQGVGSTALYHFKTTRLGQSSPSWSRKVCYHVGHERTYVGSGWIATQTPSDGPRNHYIILPDARVYGCDLPGLHPQEQDDPVIHPYVTTTNPLERPQTMLFAHDAGLSILSEAVKRKGQPLV
jgi:hypothetical protein